MPYSRPWQRKTCGLECRGQLQNSFRLGRNSALTCHTAEARLSIIKENVQMMVPVPITSFGPNTSTARPLKGPPKYKQATCRPPMREMVAELVSKRWR